MELKEVLEDIRTKAVVPLWPVSLGAQYEPGLDLCGSPPK